jgi:hypothetical protein
MLSVTILILRKFEKRWGSIAFAPARDMPEQETQPARTDRFLVCFDRKQCDGAANYHQD